MSLNFAIICHATIVTGTCDILYLLSRDWLPFPRIFSNFLMSQIRYHQYQPFWSTPIHLFHFNLNTTCSGLFSSHRLSRFLLLLSLIYSILPLSKHSSILMWIIVNIQWNLYWGTAEYLSFPSLSFCVHSKLCNLVVCAESAVFFMNRWVT